MQVNPDQVSAKVDEGYSDYEEISDSMEEDEIKIDRGIKWQISVLPQGLSQMIDLMILESQQYSLSSSIFNSLQTDITHHSRLAVVDWMYRVSKKIKLYPEIIFNAVSLLDRVLIKSPIQKSEFQLLGAVCLWISTKMEKASMSHLSVYVTVCQNQFTPEMFQMKELQVFSILKGRLDYVTSYFFYQIIMSYLGFSSDSLISHFLLDLSLLSFSFSELTPSFTAASAIIASLCSSCHINQICSIINCHDIHLLKKSAKDLVIMGKALVTGKSGGIFFEYCNTDPQPIELAMDRALQYLSE